MGVGCTAFFSSSKLFERDEVKVALISIFLLVGSLIIVKLSLE
jgi:hypothetical protein